MSNIISLSRQLNESIVFSSLNVITQEQDIHNATHSKNPHSRYTTKADWGALHKISSRLLTLIGSLQLLGEIVLHRREKTSESAGKQRWNYISAVEALKWVDNTSHYYINMLKIYPTFNHSS